MLDFFGETLQEGDYVASTNIGKNNKTIGVFKITKINKQQVALKPITKKEKDRSKFSNFPILRLGSSVIKMKSEDVTSYFLRNW